MINNYALINKTNNTVEKLVYWDGQSEITINDLPEEYELIFAEDKVAKIWDYDSTNKDFTLIDKIGLVCSGMLWDGSTFSMPIETKPTRVIVPVTTNGLDEF